jgi:NADPH:quinone reductase-like Zn-dependent oxidoreductase
VHHLNTGRISVRFQHNVGCLAVQMAKARGAHVTGVDAAHRLDLLRSLGADRVIDYAKEDFAGGTQRYDLVFDIASTSSAQQCERVLTPTGRYWVVGHDHFGKATGRIFGSIPRMIGFMLSQMRSKRAEDVNFKFPPVQELLETLRQQLESGQLTPIIARVFALHEVPAAMRCLEEGKSPGRIVIAPVGRSNGS